ncbi:MAG: acetolactate synthase small subunit [Candidatus Hydrogenedentota bacterium]|nr:MAG: acetolactate synthase small subunit [Candidatus Hydrogenedentota bacterium]
MVRRHTISVLVENQHGVLARIAGLFAARGFNIDSLTVGRTKDDTLSRMTIVVLADDETLEQIVKQLDRLVTTVRVEDYVGQDIVERELILLKVQPEPEKRNEVFQIVEIFRGKVVDLNPRNLVIEITGSEGKLAAIIEALKPYNVQELARSGKIAMARGKTLRDPL